LAAGIGEGNVAGITFANRIRETVWLLCAVPLGTAVFPYLSEYAAKNDIKGLGDTLSFSMRVTAFLALPVCLFMLFFSEPIVRVLFQRGEFNADSTMLTSSALLYYSAGALFYALDYVVFRVYYSLRDSKTPLLISIAAFLVNISIGMLLRKGMLVGGIALARSLSDFAVFVLLVTVLVKRYPVMEFKGIFLNITKIGVIAVLCVSASLAAYKFLPAPSGAFGSAAALAAAFTVFTVSYICASLAAGVEEMMSLKRQVLAKFQ
jgi:putative peptidoglycan lipid II flippase